MNGEYFNIPIGIELEKEEQNTQVNYPSKIDNQFVTNGNYTGINDNINKKKKKKKSKKKNYSDKTKEPKSNFMRNTGIITLVGIGLYQVMKRRK